MASRLPQLKLEQIYPPVGVDLNLNTCGDPDCGNYGVAPDFALPKFKGRGAAARKAKSGSSNGLGEYILSDSPNEHDARLSTAFEYASKPVAWNDARSMTCKHSRGNRQCDVGLSVLSNDHLAAEIERLRNANGVLDGVKCAACGVDYLNHPDEFVFNGLHGEIRTAGSGKKARRQSVRIIHKPCRGKPGARLSVSHDHARQRDRYENIKILKELVNGAGMNDIRRLLTDPKTGRTVGVNRLYRRIFWLEKALLAYERAQLAEWHARFPKDPNPTHHRIAHDDIVLSVNWETSTDRRITALNCSVSADIASGYVYRVDVDFDPTVDPVSLVKDTYFETDGSPKNIRSDYAHKNGYQFTVPKLQFQRPTGRFEEHHLFGAASSQLGMFSEKFNDAVLENPMVAGMQGDADEAAFFAKAIEELGSRFFNFRGSEKSHRTPFLGATVRDTYTKAATLFLLKEMLTPGRLTLVGEQEAALVRVVPHVFRKEIEEDSFEWLTIAFDKKAKKPAIQGAVSSYQAALRSFRSSGMDPSIGPETSMYEVIRSFTKIYMQPAVQVARGGGQAPYPISNFQSRQFPALWLTSPAQTAGEINKVVGFTYIRDEYRKRLKGQPFNMKPTHDDDLNAALARRVFSATLQPASTFMNSLRERISPAQRAGSGGARVGGSYINGGSYSPRVLIALINIYRVHYNFFEPRQYVSALNKHRSTAAVQSGFTSFRVPGTQKRIQIAKRRSRAPVLSTPAMRLGLTPFHPHAERQAPPDLTRILYRPWLYAGTPLFAKLEGR